MIAFETDAPRVFAVPPGADFAAALVRGLRRRMAGAPPEALAAATLTLNARRAARAVAAAFEAEAAGSGACFLPRLRTLDDLADDPLDGPSAPAIDPARRLLSLTRLTEAALKAKPSLGPPAAAPALAAALGRLLDEAHREGADLARIDAAVPSELAARWETTREVLSLVLSVWPQILGRDEGGAMEAEARRRAAVEAMAARWAAEPPEDVVIAGGSTGSRAVTALFLQAVAKAPRGAVVLPGFEPELAAELSGDVGEAHPWSGMLRLLGALGLSPRDVRWWDDADPAGAPRRRLLTEALRPAPATVGWLEALPRLRAEAAAATEGLAVLEAADARAEAEAVALALREAVERGGEGPGASVGVLAALITPDRGLARRVSAALARWGIAPDDSGGRPLALTPPGVFLKLVGQLAFGPFDPVALAALLKHPLCGAGEGRAAHMRGALAFELRVLRRAAGLDSLAAAKAALEAEARRRAEADAPLIDDGDADWEVETGVFAPVLAILEALAALGRAGPSLSEMAAAHLATAERLSGGEVWRKEAGAAARLAAEGFAAAAEVYGDCADGDYPALFGGCLTGATREEGFVPDPRVAIWGPLEARTQTADLLVLGGLNEGAWPGTETPDPWMSRAMREAAGLPPPERGAGLAAHDFLLGACAGAGGRGRVILSRALREGGAPTTRSRLLERLLTLARGVDPDLPERLRERGAAWARMAAALSRPAAPIPSERRPAPRPPVSGRPRKLSATQVETLIRDPFAIYARKVLGLRSLGAVGREIGARDRGEALHEALSALCALDGASESEIAAAFDRAATEALDAAPARPAQRRLWLARLARARERFVADEVARRAALAPGGRPLTEAMGLREDRATGFRLTARADRIDLRADGSVAIYDVKAGSPPSAKEIAAFAQQMPLEAAIAETGGFEGAPAAKVSELAHIALGSKRGATVPLEGDPAEHAAKAWEGLMKLVAAYADPALGYVSRARVKRLTFPGDYDHLARLGEWRDGDPAEGAVGGETAGDGR